MHLEVLVEEPSAEQAVGLLLPKILGDDVTFALHPFRGKHDLLRKLPRRLRGYAHWVNGTETRIVVLIDEDRQDCEQLKAELEEAAAKAGLSTKSIAGPGEPFMVLNRLAVEELEAWFLATVLHFERPTPVCLPTWSRVRSIAFQTKSLVGLGNAWSRCFRERDTTAAVYGRSRRRLTSRPTWTRRATPHRVSFSSATAYARWWRCDPAR